MPRTTTMKDVAEAAGVSVMTVSRAFKDDASVKAKTRELIHKTADEMGYVFDTVASNLRTQRSNFVAVIIPSVNNANFASTLRGLSDEIEATGRQVLLGNSNYSLKREEQLIDQLLQRRPDAIVLTGGRHSQRARQRLLAARIPVIETWDLPDNPVDHVVGFSNAATMEALVDHLMKRGRKNIAFIGGDTGEDTRGAERRSGFVAAMLERGLSAHRLAGVGPPPASMSTGAEAMARILTDFPDADAVIGVSDLAAFGALTECQRRGVAVPDQVAIAGFGAYEISRVCVPSLTTVDVQPREIGRSAAKLILEILDGEPSHAPRKSLLRVPTKISVGGSAP
ncbi:MAG: LacI family DNA-binding transcriptional regulator [Pseudomonadota bacterium]